MAKYDDFQNVHSVVALSGSATGTRLSAALDTKGMEQVTVILKIGVAVTTGTLVLSIQDSDAIGGTYVDVTDAIFTIADDDDDGIFVGKIKTNRDSGTPIRQFLKIEGIVATAAVDYGCVMIGSNLSGHIPYVTNALPTPTFNIGNP